MEQQGESSLDIARRHVREAEERVSRQRRLMSDMAKKGLDTTEAERLLLAHEDFLKVAREHLQIEEQMALRRG